MRTITRLSVLLLVFLLPSPSSSSAKIWLVDNTGNPNADFTTLTAALASTTVQNGDTLLMAASALPYSSLSFEVTKRLVFIGPGYFLAENVAQANLNSAVIQGEVTLRSGASGSVFTGLTIDAGGGSAFYNVDNISNIVIRRCRLFGGNNAIYIGGVTLNGLIVVQNYIVAQASPVISIQANPGTSILIENNYIRNTDPGAGAGQGAIGNSSSSSITFRHNVVEGAIAVNNALVENNIIATNNDFTANNSIVRNNISATNNLPGGNGNQNNITMSNVFVGSGSTDGRWQLKSGSVAIGAGFNGVDCGMFGGSEPYILSGVPSIPRIIEFVAPKTGSSQSGLPIQLRVKAQN